MSDEPARLRAELEGYEFEKSGHSRGIRLGLAIVCLLSLCELVAIITRTPQLLSWENGLAATVGLVLVGALWYLGFKQLSLDDVDIIAYIGALAVGPVVAGVLHATGEETIGVAIGVAIGIAIGIAIGGAFGIAIGDEAVVVIVGAIALAIVGAIVGAIIGAIVGAIGSAILVAIDDTAILIAILIVILIAILVVILITPFGAILFAIGNEAMVAKIAFAIGGAILFAIGGALYGAIVGAIGGLPFYLSTMFLLNMWGWTGVIVFWLVWLIGCGLLRWDGARRQRQAQSVRGSRDAGAQNRSCGGSGLA